MNVKDLEGFAKGETIIRISWLTIKLQVGKNKIPIELKPDTILEKDS